MRTSTHATQVGFVVHIDMPQRGARDSHGLFLCRCACHVIRVGKLGAPTVKRYDLAQAADALAAGGTHYRGSVAVPGMKSAGAAVKGIYNFSRLPLPPPSHPSPPPHRWSESHF